MAKILFKGIQQVVMSTFTGKTADEKKGYLWFVREPVGDTEGAENPLGNDKFHIYFGTRCYGSFWEGEHEVLAASLDAVKNAIGLGEDFSFAWEGATTVVDAFDKVKGWYDTLAQRVSNVENDKADKTALADYVADVEYADGKILFKNAEGTQLAEVDATPFIKDGMLSDVEVVVIEKDEEGNIPEGTVEGEKYIKFTWNTDGEEKVDYVLASEIGATYEGSDSIEISADNKISVKAVASEKVSVNEIPVGGTPLAELLLAKNITSISAGNLQVVLEELFSVNSWAENPRRNVPSSLTVSMNNPSISFSPTATTVEVGTEITVSASAANASASATLSYSGFTYGYSAENDNSKDGDTPASVTVTGTKDTDSNYKLEFTTNNGFASKKLADANAQNISSVENYDNKVIVAEGTNKITVKAYSPTFSGTVGAQNAVYACSSLKKTDEEHKVAASSASTISGDSITKESSDSVTGAYYAFVGFADAIPSNDGFRNAIGNGFTRLGKGAVTAGTCNKTYMFVCVPSGWDFTCNTSLGSDMRGSFTDTGDATITLPNGDTKAYKYYALTYKDGAFKDLVIK